MQNMDKYRNFTEISENSEGTANKKYQSYQEQLQAAQNRLAAAWEKIAQDADIASFITTFTNFATFMVKNLPLVLKLGARLLAIWNAYKVPSILSRAGNFLGVGSIGGVISSIKENGLRGVLKKKDQEILNYGSDESHRFGLGTTNNILNRILEQVTQIKSGDDLGNLKEYTAEMGENAEKAAASSYVALENEELKTTYSEEGAQWEAAATAQDATQYTLEANQTAAKGGQSAAPAVRTKGLSKKGTTAVAIAGGIAGIATGIMTTGATHISSATGKSVESSSEASGAMKGVSAGINTVGMVGYAWGPVVGMITQSVASIADTFLTPLIGKWIDAERDARLARVEEAEKQLAALGEISSAVSSIENTVTAKPATYEENQQLIAQMKELRETIRANKEAMSGVIEYMKNISGNSEVGLSDIYDTINNWANLSEQERRDFMTALSSSIELQKSDATIAAAEEAYDKSNRTVGKYKTLISYEHSLASGSNSKYSGSLESKGQARDVIGYIFEQWAEENGIDANIVNKYLYNSVAPGGTPNAYAQKVKYGFKTSGEELAKQMESFSDYLKDYIDTQRAHERYTADELAQLSEIVDKYEEVVDDYKTQQADLKQVLKEANETRATAALLQASIATGGGQGVGLLAANDRQLKRAGREGIYNAVVSQLLASGGFRGYSIESKEGQAIIEQAIKSNERLYAVWTGQIYTLNEALSSQNTEVMKSFATALGVSVDELDKLKDQLGDLRLADILGSPSETRAKSSELTSLFTSMASGSAMTAENMETIVNKFPELISSLKDGVALGSNMLNMIGQYNALYGRQMLADLLGNEDYFDEMLKELEKTSQEAYNDFIDNSKYGGATNAQGILGLLAGSFEDSGLKSEETYNLLQSLYKDYFDFTVKSTLGTEAYDAYVSYWNKVWDKQISNLEEQKSALQEINKQREYENKLVEAKLRLEDASKDRKRVYREGVGWVYEADQKTLREAQENLEEVEREQQISALEQQIAELNYMKERLDEISEGKNFENLENLWKSFVEDGNLKETITSQYSTVDRMRENLDTITTVLVKGSATVEDYIKAREDSYNAVFGQHDLGSYTFGSGSAWDDLRYAEQMKNSYAPNTAEYDEWETKYNNALTRYQHEAGNYKTSYGTTFDWDANLSPEQKQYMTGETTVEDSVGSLFIKKNGEEKEYTTDNLVTKTSNPGFYDYMQKTANTTDTHNNHRLETWQYEPGKVIDLDNPEVTISESVFNSKYGGNLDTWAQKAIEAYPQGTVFSDSGNHKKIGIALGEKQLGANASGMYELKAARLGSLGLSGGPTLLNEEGTEAIITPGGTLTSLPSKTGIVPADITRSVWQLGELAPSILRALGYAGTGQFIGGSGAINNNDSVNIGSVYMQVSADESFDAERFVELLKAQAALSKNNRR